MKFRIYFSKAFLISNWILVAFVTCFAFASLSFVYVTVRSFHEYSLFQFTVWILLEFFGIYIIFSTLFHGIMGLFPYVTLEENHLVVKVFSKPFHKIIKELSYTELELYSSVKDSETAQKKCSVTKIGAVDTIHSIALKYTDEVYLISLEEPFVFCKELSYRIEQAVFKKSQQ